MIDLVIPYLNTKIETLSLFKNVIGLCEIITEGEESYPAHYWGKGEYKDVSDFDYKKGLIYFRKNGTASIDQSDTNSVGSENEIKIIIPIKCVFSIPKKTIKGLDDSYIDEKMCLNLINVLSDQNIKSLKISLKASTVSILASNWNTNREQVWAEEYKGIPMGIDFEYVYASIDLNISIEGSTDCFTLYNCE